MRKGDKKGEDMCEASTVEMRWTTWGGGERGWTLTILRTTQPRDDLQHGAAGNVVST